jgi:Polyketide cyclase / dehydrase and lipid transport
MEAVMTSEREESGKESKDSTVSKESAGLTEELPMQRLAQEAKNLLEAFAEKILASVSEKVSDKVNEVSSGLAEKAGSGGDGGPGIKAAFSGVKSLTEGKSPFRAILGAGATGLKEKVKGIFGKKGSGGKKGPKLINIVESIDVGVPLRLAYDQWTQYEQFPSFMKKVEHVERPEDEKSNWKAQVFWSHRTWEATTLEQVPDDHIVWRSKGPKGYVDGAISFSELAPNLTRILLVMEYHPQGLFERTGNIWRAQGRRARLDFKHFRRHVMAHAILNPDDVEGWRGEIRDGEVVKSHEDAMEEEERAREEESEKGEEEPSKDEGAEGAEGAETDESSEESEDESEPSGEEAEGEPEEGDEESDEASDEPDEAAEAEPDEGPDAEQKDEGADEDEGDEESEGEDEPEEPEPPKRTRSRAPAEGERARPARRRAPSEEKRPRARPPRRRPPSGGDEAEEQPVPARRPRRRPPRDREGESE